MAPRWYHRFDKEILELMTTGFSEDNFIGEFQFGKIYRGTENQKHDRLTKVWDKDTVDGCEVWLEDKQGRMRDEACLTYDERLRAHPNMIDIVGISCPDYMPAVVYDVYALDTLHNLLDEDNFSWLHRVKVALGLASLLRCMHECTPLPYLIRNISAAHIVVDQDYNAKLIDFSMISGGILADKTELLNQRLHGCYGYIDPDYMCRGIWSEKCDVFAFGVVLIGLLSKKVYSEINKKTTLEPFLYEWALNEYHKSSEPEFAPSKFSLAHKSLEAEPFFCERDGAVLTSLAMQCVNYNPDKRPTMKQIVRGLWELFIVQHHEDLVPLGCLKDIPKLTISGRQYLPPTRLSYEDIKSYTNGFCDKNFINSYSLGKLYHGNIGTLKVTVKTWEDCRTNYLEPDDKIMLREELTLLQHPKFVSHPHIVKLIGYCYENEKLSTVYNLESVDSLYNLITDDTFTWYKRIYFILELANLIKYLQQKNPSCSPYVLRNIFPDDILVDKHYMPKIFNFGMLSGGIVNDKEEYHIQPFHRWEYYTDPYTNCYDNYTKVSDIYSLGMVILNIITMICHPDSEIQFDEWVRNEFKIAKSNGRRFSLVNNHFHKDDEFDRGDGRRLTKLAMQCIHCDYRKRPLIKQVMKQLMSLKFMTKD